MFIRSHRLLTGAATLMTLVLAASACSSDESSTSAAASDPDNPYAGSGSVVFAGFGGDGQDAQSSAWFEPFTEDSNIEVQQDNPSSFTRVQQMVEADHVIWDIIDGGADFPGGTEDNEALSEIDCSVVSCDDFTGPYPVQAQSVPSYIYSYVLAYNTEEAGDTPPTGLQDLWNTEDFPGTRMIDGTYGFLGLLEQAVLHAGVSREEMYPLDVDLAFEELDKIKDDLVFYSDQQECVNAVSSGDAVLGYCFNGRTTLAKEAGNPIEIAWGQQAQAPASLLIPANSPNPENAQKLAAWITSAEHNGDISGYLPYAPANPNATPTGKYADDVPTANELEGDLAPIYVDLTWWGENAGDLYERVALWTGA
jgi:putative spermidine/putrescine transport system substrate-binding protein